jgi:nicotinamide mononucleotide transporter
LYAIWFYQAKYYASFATQFIFIGFGIWGWFGWGKKGAQPSNMSLKSKWISLGIFGLIWIAFAPYLKSVGAVSIWSDTFGLLGSATAQILMVRQKWESWVLWFAVDVVLTVQYARGGYYFTSLVYAVFTVMATLGWIRWYAKHKKFKENLKVD